MLLAEGVEVVVIDDLSTGYRQNLHSLAAAEFIEGDIRDRELVADAVRGADTVFHLAASVGNKRSLDDPFFDAEVNVLGTLAVLESMRAAGVPKIVFSSSAGIFGELRDLPIREDHAIEPESPYGVSKLAAEKMCLAYAKLYGLSAVALRYFNVYGVNQRFDAYGNVIPIFVHRMLRREPLIVYSDGEQTRDFVNVRDVARANLLAARSEVSGAFNIASGTSITINALIDLLAVCSGTRPSVEHAPPRPGDVRHSLADLTAAGAALGYDPSTSLDEGLPEYFEWMRAELEAPLGGVA
jgi:UDP-glucose 4-epimerase